MIPFRDRNPSGTVPVVTIALIIVNVLVFLHEVRQGARAELFVRQYGLVPSRVFGRARDTGTPALRARGRWLVLTDAPAYTVPVWLTFLTAMFLHGGWAHLIGNMWYLWIFGDNVEDRMGHVTYLIFYLVCGVGAGAMHAAVSPSSSLPMVGASGAIAGVLGAYLLAFPRAGVSTLIFLGFFVTVVELPAVVLLGIWFVMQLFSGVGSLMMVEAGGVAWWAHVGGFVLGMILLVFLQKPRQERRAYVYR